MLNISPAGFYLKVNKNDKIKLNQFGNIIEVGNEDKNEVNYSFHMFLH